MESGSENEIRQRAEAAEKALLLLVDHLAMRGTISLDEGQEIVRILSEASHESAARASHTLHTLSLLRQLRRGVGSDTPGAPVNPVSQ
ncbi:hypothetical protein [Sinorhizobium sp. BG8]|uniref:hypothetical protein n=1 Tax=Sinorhizobium sp. BG8 TaxID=2613773 RepID=UPI00193E6117|nr:hypothetical protein [Sinorhizobium sp. BG8]QRM55836.1 hypothetical protein F3Y30_15830 [Sinorhizobium sp. BG8]